MNHRKVGCGFQFSLLSNNYIMNRYFLVVAPGLERLLFKEIQGYVPRLRQSTSKVNFTVGGIELDCISFYYT